jgi:hypothetical protein
MKRETLVGTLGLILGLLVSQLAASYALAQESRPRPRTFKMLSPRNHRTCPNADRHFPERVYWGDTHLHTAISLDAGAAGCRLGPREAYRFAKGEQVVAATCLRIPYPPSREPFAAGLGDYKIVTTLCPGGKERMRRLMELVRHGRLDLTPLLTHTFSLDQITEAHNLFGERLDGVIKVAIKP